MGNVFAFRSGHHVRGADAQTVGSELERLRDEHGILTPQVVVESAQATESPLHSAFEWNDDAAASQYRLQQARKLLVSVRVINSPVQVPLPAFVSVRMPDAGRQYMPSAEALSDDLIRARILDEVRQALESIERRYRFFKQAADVIQALKQAVS